MSLLLVCFAELVAIIKDVYSTENIATIHAIMRETVISGIAKNIRTQIETKLQEDVEYISFTTDV